MICSAHFPPVRARYDTIHFARCGGVVACGLGSNREKRKRASEAALAGTPTRSVKLASLEPMATRKSPTTTVADDVCVVVLCVCVVGVLCHT